VVLTPVELQSRGGHKVLTQELFIPLDRKVFAGRLIDNGLRKVGIKPKVTLPARQPACGDGRPRAGVSLLPACAPPWPAFGHRPRASAPTVAIGLSEIPTRHRPCFKRQLCRELQATGRMRSALGMILGGKD
jgi:hypothetical protein